ncbi:MAG TPA: TIGR04282 family arsenosugar biosynthesis glycosyltransferase [Solirubrobacteraceae bacterium]
MSTLAVIAKAPVAGRSKTRLTPPCTPCQAATLAEAALADTLAAVAATPAQRHVVVLDGEPGPWLPPHFEVIAQRGAGLGERLAAAFRDIDGEMLVVGMDTPQVTRALLTQALTELRAADAVLGAAPDGGYWAIGLGHADDGAFAGVPMSAPTTCAVQRERLRALGLRTRELPPLRDVDEIADAYAVAATAPQTRFARTLAAMDLDRTRVAA